MVINGNYYESQNPVTIRNVFFKMFFEPLFTTFLSIHFLENKVGREEGIVEEVNYIATTIRRADNSVVVVPNQVFSKGEIINWSRTPYRLFKTSVSVKVADYSTLGTYVRYTFLFVIFLYVSNMRYCCIL